MKKITVVLYGFAIFLFSSCSSMSGSYDIVHKNIGKEDLNDVSVSYGKFQSVCGYLGAGFESHHSFANEEENLQENASVVWKRVSDGKEFKKLVVIDPFVRRNNFRGDVIFEFNDDKVRLTWEEEK